MLIERANLGRDKLKGSVAVVTGAGRGIGRETARALAFLGASVVIAEYKDTGADTENMITKEGGEALFVRTDVSNPESMEALRDRVLETYGDVDILVNNAATLTTRPLVELSVNEFDRVLEVNLRGAFLGIKAFLPGMLKRGSGVIVTMESAEGIPYMAPYMATKVGLRSLAFSLAQEVGEDSGVYVYCFGPGIVETPGFLEAVRDVAPRFGVNFQEFLDQSGTQFISAEVSATGLVGTILHAEEFHGEETMYMTGLTKLGLTVRGEKAAEVHEPEVVAPIEAGAATQSLRDDALELNRHMEEIVRANLRELNALPMMARPFVKRMFKQDAGLKAEDWLASAQEMTQALEALTKGSGIRPSKLEAYIAQVRGMLEYIRRQEEMVPGWIKDKEELAKSLDVLRERRETTQRLINALVGIQQETPP